MKKDKKIFRTKECCLKNSCGFTLIEMISAIVLMGVIGIFSTQFITSITQSAQLTTAQKGLVDDAKLAMEYLLREVRVSNTNGVSVTSTPTVVSVTFNKFNGYAVDTNPSDIKYEWTSASKTLTRTSGISGTQTTLATQMTSFVVDDLSDSDSEYYVFTMTLEGPNGENFTLESGVRPRFDLP